MKIRITMKDPDCLHNAVRDAAVEEAAVLTSCMGYPEPLLRFLGTPPTAPVNVPVKPVEGVPP